ncbi:hypothetical protein N7456_006142 [Penicillium angulare]|uniref:Uncharacterized protein n=1 Tax=Penicillium angulare TaxID=116970 RepID=A0A9W9FZV3_9EURO|nr:hypothetical protein N7456_006142 [Penicillium angulare]
MEYFNYGNERRRPIEDKGAEDEPTLEAYNLPWAWDEIQELTCHDFVQNDSNYLLIKRWITADFQEELFSHSKRLKESEMLDDNNDRTEEENKARQEEVKFRVRKWRDDTFREQAEQRRLYDDETGERLRRLARYERVDQEEAKRKRNEEKRDSERVGYGRREQTQAKSTYEEAKHESAVSDNWIGASKRRTS